MTLYHKCLGDDLTLTKLGDTPMKEMFPKEKWERLINPHLKSGEIEIPATGWMAFPTLEPEQKIDLSTQAAHCAAVLSSHPAISVRIQLPLQHGSLLCQIAGPGNPVGELINRFRCSPG